MNARFEHASPPQPDGSPDRDDGGAVGALIRSALARAADRSDAASRRALEALDLLAHRIEGAEREGRPAAAATMLAALAEQLGRMEAAMAAGRLEEETDRTRIERRIDDLDKRMPLAAADLGDVLARVEAKAQAAAEAGERVRERLDKTLADDRAALHVAIAEAGREAATRTSDETVAVVERSIAPLTEDLRRVLRRFETGAESGGPAELAKALSALEQERARLAAFRTDETAPAARTAESVEAVRRELCEIRLIQEAADRRVAEALSALQRSLELLANRASAGVSASAQSNARDGATVAEVPQDARDMLAAARAAAARAVEEMDGAEREAAKARLLAAAPHRRTRTPALTDHEIDALTGQQEPAEAESAPLQERDRPAPEMPGQQDETARTATAGEDVAAAGRPDGHDLAEIIRSIRRAAQRDPAAEKTPMRRSLRKPLMWSVAAIALVAGGVQAVSWLSDARNKDRAALSGPVAPQGPAAKATVASPPVVSPEVPADMRAGFDPADADMLFRVALRHLDGTGVPRDSAIAERWLRQAAEKGSAKAAYRLGAIFEKGLLGTRDADQAKEWYRRAADAGNVAAMHNHAVMLAGGERPDFAQAAVRFRSAAEYGLRDSQYNAAVLAARGLGGPVDFAAAFVFFSLAASNGDASAAGRRDEAARRLDPAALAAAKAQLQAFKVKTPDPAANEPAGGV